MRASQAASARRRSCVVPLARRVGIPGSVYIKSLAMVDTVNTPRLAGRGARVCVSRRCIYHHTYPLQARGEGEEVERIPEYFFSHALFRLEDAGQVVKHKRGYNKTLDCRSLKNGRY